MRVLFVEDNDQFRILIKNWLKDTDFNFDIVDGGFDAVKLLQEKHYDYVITDLYMPELSGPKLVDYIKHKYPSVKLVIMSVHPLDMIKKLTDIDNIFVKPTSKEEFIKIIENIITSQ
jgi:DNA-binding NtrC family response regulator